VGKGMGGIYPAGNYPLSSLTEMQLLRKKQLPAAIEVGSPAQLPAAQGRWRFQPSESDPIFLGIV